MGTFLTPTIIAKEALIVLENNLVLANLVHRDYSKEFQQVGATVLIRKPATFTSATVSSTVNMQTATESSVAVVLDTNLDISLTITSAELSLNIVDFSEQVIQPIMRAHAQAIDNKIAQHVLDFAPHFNLVAAGTPAVSDVTAVGAAMSVVKAPLSERRMIFHPASQAAYMALDSFLHADKRADGGKALRDAEMGRVLGFDCYMDQNIPAHTYADGALTDLAGAASAATVGATVAVIYNLGTAEVLAAGDVFKPTGAQEWCVLTTGATLAGGIGTVRFQPPLVTALTDAQVVTFVGTHRCNMAFHKNAIALVSAPLAPPLGGAASSVINYKGLSARVVYDYTIMEKNNLLSIDLLIGTKTLDRNLGARLCDCRAAAL